MVVRLLPVPFFVELLKQPGLVALMMLLSLVVSTLLVALSAYGALRLGVQALGNVGEA